MKIEIKPQKLILFQCQCGWRFFVDEKKIRKDGKYKCPQCGKLANSKCWRNAI